VIWDGSQVVGEEVWKSHSHVGASEDSDLIYLGRSLKLSRKGLAGSKGKLLKVCYRALRFPEVEAVNGVRDVVSVTVNAATHKHIAQVLGWDEQNPNLGTVLIGFNTV